MIVPVLELQVGDIIVEDGRVEVLTLPVGPGEDGRMSFRGRDKRGVSDHRIQPSWSVQVERP